MPDDRDLPEQIMWQGRFITARKKGRWEYVSRARGIRAAVILAVDEDDHVILLEQNRGPPGPLCLGPPPGPPGMVSESFTLLRAHDLTKVGEGGGTDSENITVHRVPLKEIASAIADWRAHGYAIDVRILMLLGPQVPG